MVSTVASLFSAKITILTGLGFSYYKFLINRLEYYRFLNHNNDPESFLINFEKS
jgi:hypothetical protein